MEPVSFYNQEVVLGSLVVDGRLPDIETHNCKVSWGDYPPARIGNITFLEECFLSNINWWAAVRAERRWLFFLRYSSELWMGRFDPPIVFENCTFVENTSEAVEISSG